MKKSKRYILSLILSSVMLISMFTMVMGISASAASGTPIINSPLVASEWDIRTALECGIDSDGNVYALNQYYKAASVAYNVDHGVDLNESDWELKFTLDNPSTDENIYFLAGIGDMSIAIRNFSDGTDFKVGHASSNWGAFATESQMCTNTIIVSATLIEGTDSTAKLPLFESSYRVVKKDNKISFYRNDEAIEYNGATVFDASGFDFNAKKVFAVNNQYQNIGFVYNKMLQSKSDTIYPGITNIEMYTLSSEEEPDEPLKVSATSITLQSNIQVNYKVNASLFEGTAGYTDPYMEFTLNGKTTTVNEYDVVDNYYVFRFSNIAPDKMNDTITSVLYATKDGETEQVSNDYSIATYCYNKLSEITDGTLRTLLVDLLNYGAASQNYTNYNTDNLVNANLTEEQAGWATSETPALTDALNTKVKTVEDATATWLGAALRLVDKVEMRFIISAESIDGLTVKFTDSTGETEYATVESSDFETRAAGGYYVYFNGFDASQMSEVVYVAAYNGETAVSNTICYSIESYAYAKQNSSTLGELVIAMMKYGNAAKAYKNSVTA